MVKEFIQQKNQFFSFKENRFQPILQYTQGEQFDEIQNKIYKQTNDIKYGDKNAIVKIYSNNLYTVPTVAQQNQKQFENQIAIFSEENLNEIKQQFTEMGETQLKDLKNQKSVWIYQNSQRVGIFLFSPKNITNASKLRDFSNSIIKEIHTKKISQVDLNFQTDLFKTNEAGKFLSFLIENNYKFSLKGDVKTQGQEEDDDQNQKFQPLQSINILNDNINTQDTYFKQQLAQGSATLLSKQLANTRANVADPRFFLEIVKELVSNNKEIKLEYIEGVELLNNDLNLLYNVGRASKNQPMLINLHYNGQTNEDPNKNVIALVGKGIVFDSGGYNLKPTNYIEDMFLDKSGACSVLSAFKTAVELKLPLNITCTLALAENFVDADAQRPSDIIKSHKGLTVEIGNTDAEGRLVLADAMSWTQQKYQVKQMIELSTLTGACMVALGEETAGIFSNDDQLAQQLIKAGQDIDQPLWRLPITQEHKKSMKGEVSDLCNSGKTRYGGSCTAAAFLEHFVGKDVKWAHLDIAGPSSKKHQATGFGSNIILEYLHNFQNEQNKS